MRKKFNSLTSLLLVKLPQLPKVWMAFDMRVNVLEVCASWNKETKWRSYFYIFFHIEFWFKTENVTIITLYHVKIQKQCCSSVLTVLFEYNIYIYISFKSIVHCLIRYSLSLEFRQTFFFKARYGTSCQTSHILLMLLHIQCFWTIQNWTLKLLLCKY